MEVKKFLRYFFGDILYSSFKVYFYNFLSQKREN